MNPRSTDCEADALTTTPSRRSKSKYYLRILHDFIDIATNNSCVVYCKLGESVPSMDAKTYRRAVAQSLIGTFNSRKRAVLASSVMTQQKSLRIYQSSMEMYGHTMMKSEERKRRKLCSSEKNKAGQTSACNVAFTCATSIPETVLNFIMMKCSLVE